MPDRADPSAKGRRLARLEQAQLRALFFANGGIIKRYPVWHVGPSHSYLQSSWGMSKLRVKHWKRKHNVQEVKK